MIKNDTSSSKYRYLLKNVGVLTLSNLGSKLLSFVLIPLYTSALTMEEYGTYDLYITTLSLFIPILTLNIVDSVIRFTIDKKCNTKEVFSIGINYIFKSILIFIAILLINKLWNFFSIFNKYSVYLALLYIGNLLYDLLARFTRGIERVKDVAIAGFINALAALLLNILYLLIFKEGVVGYFKATVLAYVIAILYLIFRIRAWHFFSKEKNKELEHNMLLYSKPLVVDTLSWWTNNVSDRYIISWFVGVGANGVYSLAYKIPSVLNLFQTIFMQAWTLSAVKEFDKSNGKFYSNIYNIYNVGLVFICSLLIIFDKVIARILFASEFYSAWIYAPFLMIAVLFGSLCAIFNGIFNAAKDSKTLAKTTAMGAILNFLGNIILVSFWGPIGAAISTMISYQFVWILRAFKIRKIVKLDIPYIKHGISYLILLLQSITLILYDVDFLFVILELILLILLFAIYKKEVITIFNKIKRGLIK